MLAEIKTERLRMLLAHYLEVRGNRRMPSRRDIEPLRLGPVLPIIWISDYEPAAGTFRYRLAGEEVNQIWGTPIAGRLLSDFAPAERFSATNETFLKVLREEVVLFASGAIYRCSDRVGIGERLVLPLSSDGVAADGLIGATYRGAPTDLHLASTAEQVTRFVPVAELDGAMQAAAGD